MEVAAAYSCGGICRECHGGHCVDRPTQRHPMELVCPICRNTKAADNCTHCNGTGYVRIPTCPLDYTGSSIWTFASLARFADQGAFPISGGVLDQSESFLQFFERWKTTLNRCKAEDGEPRD